MPMIVAITTPTLMSIIVMIKLLTPTAMTS
jgi:hypothetical protein